VIKWIAILIVVVILLFLLRRKSKRSNTFQSKLNSPKQAFAEEEGQRYLLKYHERRTYFKGMLTGKYRGECESSETSSFEELYNIEVYEAKITVSENDFVRWNDERKDNGFINTNLFQASLPRKLPLLLEKANEEVLTFEVEPHEVRIKDITLENQQFEDNLVFGTIQGAISGCLIHYDLEKILVDDDSQDVPEPVIAIPTGDSNAPTGAEEEREGYFRKQYINSRGQSYWGKWNRNTKSSGSSTFSEYFQGCFSFAFILLLILFLLLIAPQVFLPLLLLYVGTFLLFYLAPYVARSFGWLFKILALLFALFIVYGLLVNILSPLPVVVPVVRTEKGAEVEVVKEFDEEGNVVDSLIEYTLNWNDYDLNSYKASFRIRYSDFLQSTNHRNLIPISNSNNSDYNRVIKSLADHDRLFVTSTAQMLDSLALEHNLNRLELAKVVVSMVQEIPYSLLLPYSCNISQYDDQFVRTYLRSNGDCQPFVRFGLYSPLEFMSVLKGDCDTRTLFLFALLNELDFDVAMMVSEIYGHSILGINLPFKGVSKTINGKRYVMWETTSTGWLPGIIPKNNSNMAYWSVSLISK